MNQKQNLYSPVFSLSNKIKRLLWWLIYQLLFRYTPVPLFGYRRWILRMLGATIGSGVNIYPSAKIWLPENLSAGDGSALGPDVKIYNQGSISIGRDAIVSQGSHLCASTHNYNDPVHPLVLAPISIGDNVWICADSFIGPGVSIADGAVIGARAVQVKDAESWSVYAGNPSVKVKDRIRFQ